MKKGGKTIESCKRFLKRDSFTVIELSCLIRTLTSIFPGSKFETQYYRELDKTTIEKKQKVIFTHLKLKKSGYSLSAMVDKEFVYSVKMLSN